MDDTSGRVNTGAAGDPDVRHSRAPAAPEETRHTETQEGEEVDGRTRQIREEIEETRGEITETIDAIQERLKPRNILANATDRVKSATRERVREMADTASETGRQALNYSREAVGNPRQNSIPLALIGIGAAWLLTNSTRRSPRDPRRSRPVPRGYYNRDEWVYAGDDATNDEQYWSAEDDSGVIAAIRNNPIPATLAGVGLGWLAFSRREREEPLYYGGDAAWRDPSQSRSEDNEGGENGIAQNVTDSTRQMAERARQYGAETADSMRRMARRRQNQLQRMLQENPLLVGAGAMMLGAALGAAVPETEAENEWMGEARDTVVDRARDVAHDAATQVQDAATSVADAAKKVTGGKQS